MPDSREDLSSVNCNLEDDLKKAPSQSPTPKREKAKVIVPLSDELEVASGEVIPLDLRGLKSSAEDFVRERPMTSVLLALGAGFLLSRIFR